MFHSAHPYVHFLRLWLTVLALFAAGPTHAVSTFTDHGDGTVSDSATGLMWDKCSWGQSATTCATGSASTHTWAAALGVSVTANAANYKGHNDWRLPNRLELESLVKIAAYSPAIDPAFPNTQPYYYWSSTLYTPYPAVAWVVYFYSGDADAGYQSSGDHVRLVRSGQSFDTFDALAPAVTAISPTSGSILGGTTVTISGTQFTGATGVTIGGVAVTGLIVVNDTTITATTPAGTAGAQNVVVTAPEGVGTGVSLFTYSAYTKIANDGSELADSALLGSLAADWACTRDNATGLLWEVKTTSGTRSQDNRYTNYDDLTQAEFWSGSAYRNPTQAEIDAAGNSIGFVNALNTGALCGFRDWKMPSQDELLALYPKINANTSFFLNALASYFWSGTPYAPDPAVAWYVNFYGGYTVASNQSNSFHVRLVRSGQSLGTFTLTLSASGTGSGNLASSVGGLNCTSTAGTTVGTCTTSPGLAEGTSVNLTATTAAGSTFTGWSGACSGTTSPCTVIMAALKSVTANFSINNYTVSFNSNGGSAVAGQTVAYNGTASAPTAPTKTGSTFAGWYADSGLTAIFVFSMPISANRVLYAKWTGNNYSITASASPTAGGTVMCSPNPVNYNGRSTCTATPATGYAFTGWSGDCSGITTSPCTLSQVMANKSVTGSFKAIATITLSASPTSQALFGQTTTVTAQVSGLVGTATGQLSFLDGGTTLATATLNALGLATYAGNLPIGTHSLVAQYAGNTAYLAGQSSALSYLIASKPPATVRISTAPNLSQIGQNVTVRVTVNTVPPANPAAGEVTGTVDVSGDGQTCSLTLPASRCDLTFSSNGRKSLTANYSGNDFYSPSSGTSAHFVGKRPSFNSAIILLLD